jgi:hypothetical protein
MPIQPFNIQGDYQTIPDVEDVSPVDGSISKRAQKTNKYFLCGMCFVVLAVLLICTVVIYGSSEGAELEVYQTSKSTQGYQQQGLKRLYLADLHTKGSGVKVKKLAFGNTQCQSESDDGPDGEVSCSGLDKPALVTVNSDVKFQTVLGFGGAFTEATALNFYALPTHIQVLCYMYVF